MGFLFRVEIAYRGRIFTFFRVTPIVLGSKPNSCKGLSAISLNDDRILIVNKGSAPDDCILFLEVGISESSGDLLREMLRFYSVSNDIRNEKIIKALPK